MIFIIHVATRVIQLSLSGKRSPPFGAMITIKAGIRTEITRTQILLLSKVKEGGWKAQKLLWITFPLEGLDIVPSQGWVPARGCVFCMPHSAGRDRLSHECSPRFLIPHSTGWTWQQTSIAFTNFAHSSTFPILQRPHSCVICVKHIALAVGH